MNKQLIDRKNPVQKFKQGKKIIKAKWGDAAPFPAPFHDYDGNPYVGTWYDSNTDKSLGTALIYNTEQVRQKDLKNPFYLNYRFFRAPSFKMLKGTEYIPYDDINSYERTGGHPIIEKSQRVSKSTPVNNIFIKGYENRRGDLAQGINGAHDVRRIQQELIKMGFLNDQYGADGKWGDNTEKAYTDYLNMLTQPQHQRDLNMSQEENGELRKFEPSRWDTIKLTPGKQYDNNWKNIKNIKFDLSSSRGMFKKGGNMLPSRNIVERFKNKINNN